MSVYLTNQIPLMSDVKVKITSITSEEASYITCKFDHYQDYDDTLPPSVLNCSYIGDVNAAHTFSHQLWLGATCGYEPIYVEIPEPVEYSPIPNDIIIMGVVDEDRVDYWLRLDILP